MNKTYILIALVVIIGGGLIGYGIWQNRRPVALPVAVGQYDGLAKCLTEKGVKLYGASWCPHCVAQKEAFGTAKQYLPYVECADSNGGQAQVCKDAGIEGYPTWVFADGTKAPGQQTMDFLIQKTGCALPTP